MNWEVKFHPAYETEFDNLSKEVQDEIFTQILFLERDGPQLGRPRADTLKGSRHSNMKELRFTISGGVWRIAFAFDPIRRAVLLVGGNKSGGGEKRFYRNLIEIADNRFDDHLKRIKS